MNRPVLIDTGPIVAVLVEADEHHEECVEQLRRTAAPLLTCWPVITEVTWLLRAYPQAIARFLGSFGARTFEILPLGEDDIPAISGILAKYSDLGVQLADAALLHLANRDGIETVFTLDKRDFGLFRLANRQRLNLIP